MDRRELVLAALSAAEGAHYTPVQIQKLCFLIDENLSEIIGGKTFNFKPYDYGPFDKAVYEELESLANAGDVDICPGRKWSQYHLTSEGQKKGKALLRNMDPDAQDYIQRVSEFVRSLSFTELVSAIYRAYPHMRANSVFQG